MIRERVYPSIQTHTQATGRWSVVDYPTQQLTTDLEGLVVPDEGTVWLCHDWDQVELWVQAAQANDIALLDAKANKWDVHALNTCQAFGFAPPPNKVDANTHADNAGWRATHNWLGKDDPRRTFSKRFVYRILYRGNPKYAADIPGAKALGLVGPGLERASRAWLSAHPAIPLFWSKTDQFILKHGYTVTWAGRKRRTLSIGLNGQITPAICRELSNHLMQGSVADLLNLTLIELLTCMPYLKLIGSKHDALKVACPSGLVTESWPVYQRIVQQARTINGISLTFPASFHMVRANGTKEPVMPC